MASYLRPTAEVHSDALLPGDPGRAMALATELLDKPVMANHARGLWGYSGRTAAGFELTVQSTGIGGPSAAVVLGELAELGVRRAIRVGTCRGLEPDLEPGDLLVVTEAIAADGVSRELGVEEAVAPENELGAALAKAAGEAGARPARVATADLQARAGDRDWSGQGVAALDLATAPLLALGARLGVATASLLVVSESESMRRAIDDEQLAEASLKLGRAAVAALSTSA